MKKVISFLLTIAFILSFLTFPAYAEDSNAERLDETRGICLNHNFSDFVAYYSASNKHKYNCSNEGCTAYIIEECYNTEFCGMHYETETLPCEKCGHGTVYIHNYVATHTMSDATHYHTLRCTNVDPDGFFGECGKTSGAAVECTLEPLQIWRGFLANHGHYLTKTCSVCNYEYNEGHYYPPGHPNYFSVDNNCNYCKQGYPYHMNFTLSK